MSYLSHNRDPILSACKATRIEQQFLFLQNSIKQSTISDGILSQCKFTSSIKDDNSQHSIDNIMFYTASRILDLPIQWQNRLWSHHYKLLSSLKQSIRTSELTDILETVSNRIRTEKHFHSKNIPASQPETLSKTRNIFRLRIMIPIFIYSSILTLQLSYIRKLRKNNRQGKKGNTEYPLLNLNAIISKLKTVSTRL